MLPDTGVVAAVVVVVVGVVGVVGVDTRGVSPTQQYIYRNYNNVHSSFYAYRSVMDGKESYGG